MQKKIDYFETYDIKDLKDMLYKTSIKNSYKTAFKLKEANGEIVNKTYLDFRKDVEAFGTKLIEMGLKDKRIAIIGRNSYSWAVSYLAAVIIGIVVPIDKEVTIKDIKEFIKISKANAFISDTKYIDELVKKTNMSDIILIDMQNSLKYNNWSNILDERKIYYIKRR